MSFLTYLKTMNESFPKKQIIEDINVLREDLLSYTKPNFELANKNFGTIAFKSKWYENFHAQLKSSVSKINSKNFIAPTLKAIDKIIERLDSIEKLVDENFNDDVLINAMNVKRINILAYLEACSFFSIYARRLLNVVMAIEINTQSDDVSSELDDILPFNLDWLKQRRDSWFTVLDIFYNGKGDLEKTVEALPDINVNQTNIKAVEAVNRNLDPHGFGFIPVVLNPAYHIGMIVAEWQVSRLHTAKAERDVLEVQVMNLKLLLDGKNDAKLQQKIKYIENERLKPLYQKISKMENSYA